MAQRWSESLILWLALWIPLGSTENSSLRVNTNVKDIEAGARTLASIQGPGNICIREEPYVEQIQIPEMQPVRVRTSSWCMEIPPRCATYKTEMREVMRVQVSCQMVALLNGRRCSAAGSAFAGIRYVTAI